MNHVLFIQDEEGYTPLIGACLEGHTDIARVLLDHGAVVHYPSKVRSWFMDDPGCVNSIIIIMLLSVSLCMHFDGAQQRSIDVDSLVSHRAGWKQQRQCHRKRLPRRCQRAPWVVQ